MQTMNVSAARWCQAMGDLREQVGLENPALLEAEMNPNKDEPENVKEQKDGEDGEEKLGYEPILAENSLEAFRHWGNLYIRYVQILKNIESCYDTIVHPQKRLDIKLAMEACLVRIVELHGLLVKWNPMHPSLKEEMGPFRGTTSILMIFSWN